MGYTDKCADNQGQELSQVEQYLTQVQEYCQGLSDLASQKLAEADEYTKPMRQAASQKFVEILCSENGQFMLNAATAYIAQNAAKSLCEAPKTDELYYNDTFENQPRLEN